MGGSAAQRPARAATRQARRDDAAARAPRAAADARATPLRSRKRLTRRARSRARRAGRRRGPAVDDVHLALTLQPASARLTDVCRRRAARGRSNAGARHALRRRRAALVPTAEYRCQRASNSGSSSSSVLSSAAFQSGSVPVPPVGISSQSRYARSIARCGLPAAVRDERRDAFSRGAVRLAKAVDDVGGDVGVCEAAEPHGHRLPVERALLRAEQLLHRPCSEPANTTRRPRPDAGCGCADGVRGGHLAEILELVERDQRAVAAVFLEAQRQVEQCMQRRQRVGARLELELHADPERHKRETEAGSLLELLDPRADAAAKLRRKARSSRTAMSARDRTPNRSTRIATIPSLRSASWSTRRSKLVLPYFRGRVEPNVVSADGARSNSAASRVPVDQVLGRDRPRVDERVGVGDHRAHVARWLLPSNLTLRLDQPSGSGAHQRARTSSP